MLKLFKGLILAYTQNIIKIVTALFFTPFLIHNVGISQYGIFALAAAVSSYLLFLDSGLKTTFTRFFLKKNYSLNQVSLLINSLFLSSLFGLCIFVGGFLLLSNINLFLNDSFDTNLEQIKRIIFYYSLSAGLVIFMTPFSGILISHERFITIQIIEIASLIISTIISIICLLNGYGIVEISLIAALAAVIQMLIKSIFAIKLIKPAKIRLGIKLKTIFAMTRFLIPIAVAFFAYLIFWRMDYIVLGALSVPSIIAIYGIGIFFNKHLESISAAVSKILMPRIIKKIDSGIMGCELNSMLINISRLQLIILAPILLSLFILGDNFILLWLGEDFQKSYFLMTILVATYAFELIGWSRNTIMQVCGIYYIRSIFLFLFGAINLVGSYFIYDFYGLEGVVLVTGASIFLNYLTVSVVMSAVLKMNFLEYLINVFGRVLLIMASIMTLHSFVLLYIHNIFNEIILGILSLIIFTGIMYIYGVSNDEKKLFKKIIEGKFK